MKKWSSKEDLIRLVNQECLEEHKKSQASVHLDSGIRRSNKARKAFIKRIKKEIIDNKALSSYSFLEALAEFIKLMPFDTREGKGKYADNIMSYEK